MTDEELEALLDELEDGLADLVQSALSQVAEEFAEAVEDADELVAASFSVSRIGRMWRQRVGGIVTGLRGIFRRGSRTAAEDLGESVPTGDDMATALGAYEDATRPLLDDVGDRLSAAAVRALADGRENGDSIEQLRQRLLNVFSDDAAQLGPSRARRIAMTEATRAFNAGTLAAAEVLTGDERPLVKQWITRNDERVRPAHREANGQLQLLSDPFDVGGTPMQFPGDPSAPASLTVNCRCIMKASAARATEERTASVTDPEEFQSRMPAQLKRYWLTGEGAAKIGWGTPGSFRRCVRELRDDFPEDPEGLCANLYHEATGRWPGENRNSAAELEEDFPQPVDDVVDDVVDEAEVGPDAMPQILTWSTPGESALAFENQQTGDGRVFAPDALYWDEPGPWPLQYAEKMNGGHDGAELAGAIYTIGRQDGRITGDGVLYLTTDAGREAAGLLLAGAPLGVSVDLDDVSFQTVDASGETHEGAFATASLLPSEDGGFTLTGITDPDITAASGSPAMVLEQRIVTMHVGADGMVPAAAFELRAAAGDSGETGTVVDEQTSGQYLMRITRARVRGATLVTIPAYASARIVLDETAAEHPEDLSASADEAGHYERAVRFVRRALQPATPAALASFLKISVAAARRILARAAKKGDLVRLTRGKYVGTADQQRNAVASAQEEGVAEDVAPDETRATPVGAVSTLTASVTGKVDLDVADRDTEWDGDAAATRVFEWADGDCDRIGAAFAWRDDSKDCTTKAAYKLGYADVIDGELTIVPRGVIAAQAAMSGARGGVDLPADERDAVAERLASVRAHVDEETGGDDMDEMQASAWKAMQDLPPMPAAWFREPTAEELPDGGPGVNYAGGRIFGWVAQANEPHAGYAKRVVINDLGKIDTSHFLRQRFTLDDGSVVKAGAFTMNVGHHRDGAECETSACQFDDTRTVAGIVTVGMNERGMWFSGAAAPWMSEWDRSVFAASQPSYHMKKSSSGQWQLRAVLSVPVPGHSSPLLASAVIERSQLALTAAATMVDVEEAVAAEQQRQEAEQKVSEPTLAELVAAAVEAALDAREERKAREAAELEALLSEGRTMSAEETGTEGL